MSTNTQAYEYRIVAKTMFLGLFPNHASIEQQINLLAQEGWEICHTSTSAEGLFILGIGRLSTSIVFVLRREVVR